MNSTETYEQLQMIQTVEHGQQTDASPAITQTHLAWLRTRMALQNTLAAWVRTATSLIGFGFAIVQFLEHFGHLESGGAPKAPHLARILGLVLIGAGSLTTLIATWEYRTAAKYLGVMTFGALPAFGPCAASLPTLRCGWRFSCA